MKHKCHFNLLASNAIGAFDKQEGQDSTFYCDGNVYQCKCKKAILVPYNSNLRIVEVEVD